MSDFVGERKEVQVLLVMTFSIRRLASGLEEKSYQLVGLLALNLLVWRSHGSLRWMFPPNARVGTRVLDSKEVSETRI